LEKDGSFAEDMTKLGEFEKANREAFGGGIHLKDA
jgi:hypothetical protein